MGKALGGAVIPVGCFISTPEVFEPFMENPYIHTTTFGGNPMATSAVIGALHATLEEDIPRQAAEKGAWFMERFEELRGRYGDLLEEVRGLGLLIGLEFVSEEAGYAVATGLFGEGVLTGGTLFSAKTFRIEPPATLTQHEMDEVVVRLERVMGRVREDVRAGQLADHGDRPRIEQRPQVAALVRLGAQLNLRQVGVERRSASLRAGPRRLKAPGRMRAGAPAAPRPSSSLRRSGQGRPSSGSHQSENPVLYQIFLVPFLARFSHFLVFGSWSMRARTASATCLTLAFCSSRERVHVVHVGLHAVEVGGGRVPEPPVVGEAARRRSRR